MRHPMKLAAVVAAMAAVSACATRPEPAPPVPPPAETPPRVEQPAQQPSAPRGPAAGSLEQFRAQVGERVFFDFDQFAIRADARDTLNRQAQWLRTYPSVRVLIAGHADERGTREYNLALGARRAAAVKDYLVSQGVAADRIETVSYGKERPLDPRSNEEGWALNRNAHTQLVSGAVS